MSLRHPKDIKFLYFAGTTIVLGLFDLFMLKYELGNMSTGKMIIVMVLVNGIGFGLLGITLFIITWRRVRQNRMRIWKDTIQDAINESKQ